ncbi:MAG: PIG-L family deacetylase [Gemmatimonadota bacterium]|nr:PIG-L family deacetylase [Gemmatimonadota bacterium]
MNFLNGIPSWRTVVVLLATTFVWGSSGAQGNRVSYVSSPGLPADIILVAHQDDWQLFMGDIVARQVRTGNQVVFIYLTAGDDGRDSLYWATRERGALESTRVAVGVAPTDSATDQCASVKALDHVIRECTIANTESYFFRLPDGRRNGTGFARHSYESLRKLRRKRIASMSAVDGSAAYNSWADLMSTVNVLIGERSGDRIVTVHTSDPSVVVNPHDHFDHRMAGLLVADSRKKKRWNVVYYAGYAVATRAANRSGDQVRQKTALFLAYDRVMTQANAKWSAYREHPAFYSECMLRTYARRVTSP